MTGVTLCGQYASPVLAADFYINGSVFAGVRAPVSSRITHPLVPQAQAQVQKKIYLTMTMVEGDNVQYDQHASAIFGTTQGRGAVPLNWSISEFLYDIGPSILSYYQRTATANDLLTAGPSGAAIRIQRSGLRRRSKAIRSAAARTCRPPGWTPSLRTTATAQPICRSPRHHRPLRARCSGAAWHRKQLRVLKPGELH
jgi:hypothetical protein